MGNTVIWKPSPTQQLAAHLTMELLEEAGLPPGVINMLPGDGLDVSEVALAPPRPGRHPLHRLDRRLPAPVADRRRRTSRRTAPTRASSARPAARTSSSPTRRADPDVLRTALIRGAFEFQGQKCSAASRAYVAASVWNEDARTSSSPRSRRITMGDVTDFSNFMGAVIDDRAFAKHKAAIDAGQARRRPRRSSPAAQVDDSVGYFVRPTVVRVHATRPTRCSPPSTSARSSPCTSTTTPTSRRVVAQMESFAPYALTGSIIAQDRARDRLGAARRCASRPATSTSTTSRPARSSASSRSAAPGPPAPTTRPAPPQNLLRWTSPALDQGDVRPAEGLPLPVHGPRLTQGRDLTVAALPVIHRGRRSGLAPRPADRGRVSSPRDG